MKSSITTTLLVFLSLSINLNAQPPLLSWAKQLGGSSGEGGNSIAVDANGNVYTTGTFNGTTDFDPSSTGTYNLTSISFDIFVSKLDAGGNFVWAKKLGIGNGFSIAVDASGNVYTTGRFTSGDFDPGMANYPLTSSGNTDIFLSKLDTDGNFVWAKRMGGSSVDECYSIAVNSISNVYTTGKFQGTIDFDPGAGGYNLTAIGYEDAFVSALDASGNFLWAKRMGGGSSAAGCGSGACRGSIGKSIAIDNNGNVYTTGYFPATGDFDPGIEVYNLTAGSNSTFVSKLDPSGNFVWAKQIGGGSTEGANSIAIDANSNVYTTGIFGSSTSDFDPGNGVYNLITTGGGTNTFISKLDASGNFVWAKSIGGGSFICGGSPCYGSSGNAIVTDANGNVYTSGYFKGTRDFDPGVGTYYLSTSDNEYGNSDIFVQKLNTSGGFEWAIRMGGPGAGYPAEFGDVGNSLALDDNGSFYATGNFWNTSDFDPTNSTYNLTSVGSVDAFVLKICQIATPTITGPTSLCQGSLINLTSSAANSYLWSTGATTQSIPVSSSGNYSVTVTNSSGCTAASTILTVFANQVPTVTVNNPTICAGQPATLTANGATSYVWSNGATTNSITVSPTSTTTYTVTGTTAGCSSAPVSALVTVNPSPTVNVDGATICVGQSATLTANGAATYFWSNGATTNSITVSPTSTTTYTVTGTTAGCPSAPASAQVTVNSLPIVTVGNQTICIGQSATLTANGAANYLWSTGETSNSIIVSPTTTTTYTVTGTTAGCSSAPVSAQIIVNQVPTVTVNNPTICAGQPATLTANGATSYVWSNGATTNSITVSPTSTTTYTVTGTTAGCSSTPVSALVTVNPNPAINLGAGVTFQEGQQAVLDATGTGLTYLWSTGATTPTITVTNMGTYSVTVTNGSGCTATDTVVVTVITTSTNDQDNKYKITLSPNPAHDIIYIKCEGSPTTSVELVDNLGRRLLKDNSFAPDGTIRTMKVDKIPAGIYHLKISGKEFSKTISMIKQ